MYESFDYGIDGADTEDDDRNEFKIHEGIILAVHLTTSISENLTAIFTTFLNLLKTLTKTMPSTGLGLYIFNCNKSDSNNSDTPEGIYRIFRLQDLNQGMLKTLDRYLRNSIPTETVIDISFNTKEKWEELLPIKEIDSDSSFGQSLYGMLQQTLLDFNHIPIRTEEYTSRKVFLFSDCNLPYNGDERIKMKIHSKLRDLNDSKITVYPFILGKNEDSLEADIKKDYRKLDEFKQLFDFPLDSDLESKKYLPAISEISLDKLEEKIIKHATVRRMAFQCPLWFGNLKISVKGINPFSSVEFKKVKFYNSNNRLHYVKRTSIPTCDGRELTEEEIVKVNQISDQYLPVNKKIQTECMKFGESEIPILHVLGTRKFKYYNPSYTVGKSLFMIADDDGEHQNSLQQFAAMYKSLCKKRMMILCWGMPRKTSHPRFYYLIPTSIIDTLGLNFDNYPQALAMIEIPFGNELRKAPDYINSLDSLSELDNTHMLDKLVKLLTLDKFHNFANPSLAWRFQIMEDHILQVEVPRIENDDDEKYFHEQQLELDEMYQEMMSLKNMIGKDENFSQLLKDLCTRYNRVANLNELKRNDDALDNSGSQVTKKARGSTSDEKLTDAKAIIYYRETSLKNCTNNTLKEYIRNKGGLIKMGKTKAVMIDNIVEYLEENQLI